MDVRIVPTTESQAERIAYLEKALAEQTEIADRALAELAKRWYQPSVLLPQCTMAFAAGVIGSVIYFVVMGLMGKL